MPRPAGAGLHPMSAITWLPLLTKALATALTVIAASVAAEALGPVWGAIIVCLPVAAGPAYVFLAMDHDAAFIATSALGSAAANAVTGLFLIIFALAVRRFPPWRSLGVAMAVWVTGSLVLRQFAWSAGAALLVNSAVYGTGLALMRRGRAAVGPGAQRPAPRRWYELPLRAASVAAFVSLVVAGSHVLGPSATGIAAVFPVSLISLLVILIMRLGGAAAAGVAVNALPPMVGFAALLLVVHLTVVPWGVPAAYAMALAVSLLWSGILILILPRTGSGPAKE